MHCRLVCSMTFFVAMHMWGNSLSICSKNHRLVLDYTAAMLVPYKHADFHSCVLVFEPDRVNIKRQCYHVWYKGRESQNLWLYIMI
jgi:hypothetical protein